MDKTALRKRLGKRFLALQSERTAWEPVWREASELVNPWRGRFGAERVGRRLNEKAYDSEATRALDILDAGLTSGLAGPSRPWFRLGLPDPELSDYKPVREWLDRVEEVMQWIFQRTNTYRALSSAYVELGLFGTAATLWQADYDNFMRGDTLTAGEYWLANGSNQDADTLYRTLRLTVAQVVERFGLDAVSQRTRQLWDTGDYDQKRTVIHAIEPNRNRVPRQLGPEGKRWLSVYWEDNDREELLSFRGLDRFPVTAPRWDGLESDVYGYGPAVRTLTDIRQLQAMELVMHEMLALEKEPIFAAPTEVANATNLSRNRSQPGDIIYIPGLKGAVQPLYQVKTDIIAFAKKIEEIRSRVQSGFYANLFLAVTYLDRRNMTAHEIDVREEEKLVALGPVLERLHHGLLSPLINFTMDLMVENSIACWRLGEGRAIIPAPPPELEGMEFQVDYISPLAQAQRAIGIGTIERTVGFAGEIAKI